MKRIVLFASGSGTNAEAIVNHFAENTEVDVALIVCNKPNAVVLDRAQRLSVPTHLIDRESFYKSEELLQTLESCGADLLVLAGFLWKVPDYLIEAFPKAIVNIHPALLPAYGGKGMYGQHVHEAVVANKENQTGITIHYVNEVYDDGEIVFQATCPVLPTDEPKDVAARIHQLEHKHFPKVIENILTTTNK